MQVKLVIQIFVKPGSKSAPNSKRAVQQTWGGNFPGFNSLKGVEWLFFKSDLSNKWRVQNGFNSISVRSLYPSVL